MEQKTRQTQTRSSNRGNQTTKRIVVSIFGLIEAFLGFRLLFKLFGANPDNGFTRFIYGATGFFTNIFKGIFSQAEIGDNAVFEPQTVIAMLVIALIAWIVLKLITPHGGEQEVKTEYSKNEDDNK